MNFRLVLSKIGLPSMKIYINTKNSAISSEANLRIFGNN